MSDPTNTPTPESLRAHVELFLPGLRDVADDLEALADPLAYAFRALDGLLTGDDDAAADAVTATTRLDEVTTVCIRLEKIISFITGDGRFLSADLEGIPDPAAVKRSLDRSEKRQGGDQ